jgi:hypothetical protein
MGAGTEGDEVSDLDVGKKGGLLLDILREARSDRTTKAGLLRVLSALSQLGIEGDASGSISAEQRRRVARQQWRIEENMDCDSWWRWFLDGMLVMAVLVGIVSRKRQRAADRRNAAAREQS